MMSNSPIFLIAVARAKAIDQLSPPSKASSSRRISSSAPMESGFLITSRSRLFPRLKTVIFSPCWSLIRSAASTACSSKGLTTGGTPGGGITLLVEGSILKLAGGASGPRFCLQQTIMFRGIFFPPSDSFVCWLEPNVYFKVNLAVCQIALLKVNFDYSLYAVEVRDKFKIHFVETTTYQIDDLFFLASSYFQKETTIVVDSSFGLL